MKLPKTTKESPYIEFKVYNNGKVEFVATGSWWGGINGGFISAKYDGNSCLPKDLEKYLNRFKDNKIKEIDKSIRDLNKKREKLIIKYEAIQTKTAKDN